jgi:hypothetical protein
MATNNADSPLKYWFAVAIVAGSGGIVAGWRLDLPTVTIGVPLAAMAAYLIAAYVSDKTVLATLQFADSLYYLGFLFTLISLTVSLLAFSGGADTDYDVSGVASRFGVALLTTVIGLGCRIYLVNFRKSIDDSLAQTEASLADAGEALRAKLDQLSVDMTVQSKLMAESLRGAIDLTASELKAVAESGKSAVEEATRAVSSAVTVSTANVANAAEEGSQAVKASLESLASKLDESPLPADLLIESLSPALAKLAEHLDEYSKILESTGQSHRQMADGATALGTSAQLLQEGGSQLTAVLQDVREGTQDLAGFSDALGAVAGAIGRASEEIEQHKNAVGDMRLQMEKDVAVVATYRGQVRENLESSQSSLEQVREELLGTVRFIRESIGSAR